jgi:site-specific recombinase XerD
VQSLINPEIIHTIIQPDFLNDFLAGQVSDATRCAYRANVRQFFFFLDVKHLSQQTIQNTTVQDVIEWRNHLMESGNKSTTVNRKLSAIRSFFDFMVALRIIDRSPADVKIVKGLKVSGESITNELSKDEIKAMLNEIDRGGNPVLKARDKAILLTLIFTGLRRSELANIRKEDIELKESHWILRIPESKGGSNQWVKIQPLAVQAITDYLEILCTISGIIVHKNDRIFIGFSNRQTGTIQPLSGQAITRIIQKYAQKAGITKQVSAHSCRHSCASLAIEAGAKPHKVMQHLRHKNLKTTMRYVHDREALRDNASDYIRV